MTISLPQCVIAEPIEGGEPSEVARSVTRFQLVFEGADVYKLQKDVVGRSADMSGRVFTAISGHHHTEALIAVKTIKLLEQ